MVSAFLGYGRAMWSLAAPWLFLDILCQGALFGNAGRSDRCPVPELLVRGYGLGLLALEVSQGFLLEMSFHKDQICSHSSIIPK